MEIFILDTPEEVGRQAAEEVAGLMAASEQKNPLLCPASGDSPAGLFRNLAARNDPDTSQWTFVGLDEWVGMNGDDEGSCRYYLNLQLFTPLKVKEDRICFFDGKADDLQAECGRTEDFIQQHGGIEVVILGLGLNGHAGMNEPGTSRDARSHVSKLDPITAKTGQKYFKEKRELTEGITLGLATILEARHIILLVTGKHKATIVKRIVESDISEALPASLLRGHHNLKIYLDNDAASQLHSM
jgi:glucosamine-6-phosphate isomerase